MSKASDGFEPQPDGLVALICRIAAMVATKLVLADVSPFNRLLREFALSANYEKTAAYLDSSNGQSNRFLLCRFQVRVLIGVLAANLDGSEAFSFSFFPPLDGRSDCGRAARSGENTQRFGANYK